MSDDTTKLVDVEARIVEIKKKHRLKQHDRADALEALVKELEADKGRLSEIIHDAYDALGCGQGEGRLADGITSLMGDIDVETDAALKEADARDAANAKIAAMLEVMAPGKKPDEDKYDADYVLTHSDIDRAYSLWCAKGNLHTRLKAIAEERKDD